MGVGCITYGVILAAGQGNRLRKNGQSCSKPMTIVAGKPLVSYAIDSMLYCGITTIVIVYHASSADVLGITENNPEYQKAITFVEDTVQTGKLSTFLSARGLVGTPFVMMYGDTVVLKDNFKNMLLHGLSLMDNKPDLVIQTVDNPSIPASPDEPWDKSALTENGRIIRWVKGGAKPDAQFPNAAVKAGGLAYIWYH